MNFPELQGVVFGMFSKKKKKKKTTSSKKEFLRTFLYLWVILVYFLLDLPKKNSSSREHPEVSWDPAETVVYDRAETFGERGCYRSGSGQLHFVAADGLLPPSPALSGVFSAHECDRGSQAAQTTTMLEV